MQFQIYWTPQSQLDELQGAVVDYVQEDKVIYRNDFLPSGQQIVSWVDSDNYFQNKRIGQLPELNAGQRYRSKLLVTNSDRMHAYLSWTFYNEKREVIDQHYQNVPEETFTVPSNYASYRVALLSAGTGQFTFHRIQVGPAVAGEIVDGDQLVLNRFVTFLQKPEVQTSKTLRVVLTEPIFAMLDLPIQSLQLSPQAVLFISTDFLNSNEYFDQGMLSFFNEKRKLAKCKDIEFVGYGPISSLAALMYRQAMKGATVVIPADEDLTLPAGYACHRPSLVTFFQNLPAEISRLRKEGDGLLKRQSLGRTPSHLQRIGGQEELLSSLSYLDWPVNKKKEKQEKKIKKQQEKKKPKQEKKVAIVKSNDTAVATKEGHAHGNRQRQLDKASRGEHKMANSSQLLQDFFTKNRH